MAADPVRFTVDLTIHEGGLVAFQRIAKAMTEGTRDEPGALAYDWYLSPDRTRCRLLETYEDADAVLAHLSGPVVRDLVPQLLEVSSLTGFEVYGDPGPEAARMLAGFGAEIYERWHGLGI